MVYKCFDKKTSGSSIKKENYVGPAISKFTKRKGNTSFIDNIQGVDLADMQLVSKFKERFRFLLCVIDIFSKYAWVILFEVLLLKMLLLRGITITNAFQKILGESNRKPNKILVDKGSEIYN